MNTDDQEDEDADHGRRRRLLVSLSNTTQASFGHQNARRGLAAAGYDKCSPKAIILLPFEKMFQLIHFLGLFSKVHEVNSFKNSKLKDDHDHNLVLMEGEFDIVFQLPRGPPTPIFSTL